jgi:hypothetical protein
METSMERNLFRVITNKHIVLYMNINILTNVQYLQFLDSKPDKLMEKTFLLILFRSGGGIWQYFPAGKLSANSHPPCRPYQRLNLCHTLEIQYSDRERERGCVTNSEFKRDGLVRCLILI